MAVNQKISRYRVNSLPTSNLVAGSNYELYLGGGVYRNYVVNDSLQLVAQDGKEFIECDTVAQLRALDSRQIWAIQNGYYKGVKLNGYYAQGDTPAPIEYYLSDTTESDDGGSVFEVGGVKLEHEFNGFIDIAYFGATPFIENSAIFINTAINYASSKGLEVVNTQNINVVASYESRWGGCIELKDNVTFTNKGTITLSPTNFPNYAIIGGDKISNVSITVGKLIGDKLDHLGSTGEWGMGIGLRDVQGFTIKDGTIDHCWGDNIYIGGDSTDSSVYALGCNNGIVENVHCNDARRNGISIVSGSNLKILNSIFSNATGTSPMAGLDIEPNTNQKCENIVVDRCKFYDNGSISATVTSHGISAGRLVGIAKNIKFVNCDFGNRRVQISQNISATYPIVTDVIIDKCTSNVTDTYGINCINGVSRVKVVNCDITTNKQSINPDLSVLGIRFYNVSHCTAEGNTIEGNGTSSAGVATQQGSFNCTVIKNEIKGFNTGVGGGIGVANIISDNDISNCYNAIQNYGSYAKISKNRLSDIRGTAIRYSAGNYSIISGNTIDKTLAIDTALHGIQIESGSYNIVSDNIITLSASSLFGIDISHADNTNNSVSNNKITGGQDGIRSLGRSCSISLNEVKSISNIGMRVYGDFSQVLNNTIEGSGVSAMQIEGVSFGKVTGNICVLTSDPTSSTRLVYLTGTTNNTLVDDNTFINNSGTAVSYALDCGTETLNNEIRVNKYSGNFTSTSRVRSNVRINSFQSTAVSDVTTADATDETTAIALVNELKAKFNQTLATDRTSGQRAT